MKKAQKDNFIILKKPDLLKEWNYHKNDNLDPENMSIFSKEKVWWVCEKGHEWQTSIASRSIRNTGCPYCSGLMAIAGENDLETLRPDLAGEWNYEKNDTLSPRQVKPASQKKVWWRCKEGHEWQAVISSRSAGSGCPYCYGKRAIVGTNDLQTTYPELAREWNYQKNVNLTPNMVKPASAKKVWWRCPNGHEWQAVVSNRTKGSGCPYCAGQKAVRGINDLTITRPDLAKEWNYEKNVDKDPADYMAGSGKKIWWKCNKGHEWQAVINSRANGSGCPYCANLKALPGYNDLATVNPELAKQWNYKRNKNLSPGDVLPFTKKRVWWVCSKGHEWQALISDRSSGTTCPYCSGREAIEGVNDLATVNPSLIKEWDFQKNKDILPSQVLSNSAKKVWWICSSCGHSWKAIIANRNKGIGCPRCSERMKTSFPEQVIYYYLRLLFPDAQNSYTEIFSQKMELDVYIPSLRIGIEYDGVAWHRTKKALKREEKKYEICKNNDIQLIRIREDNQSTKTNCDVLINSDTKYNNNTFRRIFDALQEYIHVNVDIDVERDGKRIKEGYFSVLRSNSLGIKYPAITSEWNAERNGGLTPYMFYPGSTEKIWWICEKGHEWQASIVSRCLNGTGCPYCSGVKVIAGESDLLSQNPYLASEWNYQRNGSLIPEQVSAKSNKIVWWKCQNGHEWQASVTNRAKGSGCPYCSEKKAIPGVNDLQTLIPELAQEWNFDKNGSLMPYSVRPGSGKKVWWRCSKGHEWETSICSRSNGTGCPICAGKQLLVGYNDLESQRPDLAKEWNYDKNSISPKDIYMRSSKKMWWRCEKGHEWEAIVLSRYNGTGCPICAGKRLLVGYNDLESQRPDLVKEWNYDKNSISPKDIYMRSSKKVWWRCEKGHEWEASVVNRYTRTGCPICAKRGRKKLEIKEL